jgi:hypothetical protein
LAVEEVAVVLPHKEFRVVNWTVGTVTWAWRANTEVVCVVIAINKSAIFSQRGRRITYCRGRSTSFEAICSAAIANKINNLGIRQWTSGA